MASFIRWKHRHHFKLDEADLLNKNIKNIRVQCLLCLPLVKTLSTAKSSTSNLSKHLTSVHSDDNFHRKNVKNVKRDSPSCRKQKRNDQSPDNIQDLLTNYFIDGDVKPLPAVAAQHKFNDASSSKQVCINNSASADINDLLTNYLIDDLQPLSMIETPAFCNLLRGLCGKQITMPCTTTISESIDMQFIGMENTLIVLFAKAKHICTTVDIWTVRNRSFCGMTAHWICRKKMVRQTAAIACSRFFGRLTCDNISTFIFNVFCKYNMSSKITDMVTDNASNFVKAFGEFQERLEDGVENSSDENEPIEDHGPVSIDDIMNNSTNTNYLPPHKRCASHTLKLISNDMDSAIKATSLKAIYVNALGKCSSMWNKAQRCNIIADMMENLAHVKLIGPAESKQWNSQFRFIAKILQISTDVLSSICVHLNITPFTEQERNMLEEYVTLTQPITDALNILQGKNHCYYGTLLPVLYTLKRKLAGMEDLNLLSGVATAVVAAIDKHFAPTFCDDNAKIAAVSHPLFKNHFTPNFEEKQALRELLLDELKKDGPSTQDRSVVDPLSVEPTLHSFFDFECATNSNVEVVLHQYMQECKTVEELQQFPQVKAIFLKYNTTIPSSASVDFFFGLGDNTPTHSGNKVSDGIFEKLTLLRFNKNLLQLSA